MEFDIVIVGGGLVGLSLACALKDQNLSIALIDHVPALSNVDHTAKARALALSYTSMQCLKTMGVWQSLSHKVTPILKVHASKKGHFGETEIFAADHQLPALGYVISADELNLALVEFLNETAAVHLFRPDVIAELKKNERNWFVSLESGKKLTTKLLVGADGAGSYIRKNEGIDLHTDDYQQTAIVSNIRLSESHEGVAYERFLREGSIAMLPFGENQVKSVWIAEDLKARALLDCPQSEFLTALQTQFGFRLGSFVSMGERTQYPLKLSYSSSIYGNGFVLIGNAANTLNPIAAQGFNLGLRDVAVLAESLVTARAEDVDMGSITTLSSYAAARQSDHQAIRNFTHQLATSNLLQWLGVLACEWSSSFKNYLVAYGLGRQQPLPRLCRGVKL